MSQRAVMSNDRPAALAAWPPWAHLREALLLSVADSLLFLVVYGGCDWITGFRQRNPVHLRFELSIPLVPAMVVAYLSLNGLLVLAPWVLQTRQELRALAAALAATMLAAGVGFLLLPAELAFPEPAALGKWQGLFALADRLNLRYNLVPSLHVALAGVCVAAYAARKGWLAKVVFWSWGLAIGASTVLTHQHHLLDVAAGLLLAWVVHRTVYRAWSKSSG